MRPAKTIKQAKQLRQRMTDAERKLWYHLRAGRLYGWKFRRQHPIPPFIADFCCVEHCLVIEVDGSQHGGIDDHDRTAQLEKQGWRVLRFWNHDVLLKVEQVLEAIVAFVASHPLPNPSPASGRGA